MDKKTKTQIIQTVVSFVKTDLQVATTPELANLVRNLENFLKTGIDQPDPSKKNMHIRKVQEQWRRFVSWLCDSEGQWQLEFTQRQVFSLGGEEGIFFLGLPFGEESFTIKAYDMDKLAGRTFEGDKSVEYTFEKIEAPAGGRVFLEALSGFPRSSLRRCPHCNEIFFNPTNRRMIYCSARCRSTAGGRRMRRKGDSS